MPSRSSSRWNRSRDSSFSKSVRDALGLDPPTPDAGRPALGRHLPTLVQRVEAVDQHLVRLGLEGDLLVGLVERSPQLDPQLVEPRPIVGGDPDRRPPLDSEAVTQLGPAGRHFRQVELGDDQAHRSL